MQLSRRGILTGLISLVAAPAIVRFESIMPVKGFVHLAGPAYGRSPAMDALPDLVEINWRLHWKILAEELWPVHARS